jgi:hypothetical protein
MAAAHDDALAGFSIGILTHSKANERAIFIKAIQNPWSAHCLNVKGERQPPPNTALKLVGQSALIKKLRTNAFLDTTRFDKIVDIESFRLGVKTPEM